VAFLSGPFIVAMKGPKFFNSMFFDSMFFL